MGSREGKYGEKVRVEFLERELKGSMEGGKILEKRVGRSLEREVWREYGEYGVWRESRE